MMEALQSSETSVVIRATRRNIQKTLYFIVTAVITSNITQQNINVKVEITPVGITKIINSRNEFGRGPKEQNIK
jgi:hypothetical protein